MRRSLRNPIVPLLAALVAAPASWADDAPLLKPSRDVAVEYRASGMAAGPMGGGDGTLTIHFANQGRRMRVEPPNGLGFMIVDAASGLMTVVLPSFRMYMEMPGGTNAVPMLDSRGAALRRIGGDTVAGLTCTVYETSVHGRTGQACLTDDGVLLRGRGGDSSGGQELEATKVTYAPQPAALFEPPPGFRKVDPAALGGMGALLPPGLGGAAAPQGGTPPSPAFPPIK